MTSENTIAEVQTELSLTDLAARIKERESRIDKQKDKAMFEIAVTLNLVVDQGDDLLAAKLKCGHGQWEQWVNNNCAFSTVTAWKYMRVANLNHSKDLDNVASIRQAYIAAGLLPEPETVERDANAVTIPPHYAKLNGLTEWITKERESILNWEDQRRSEFVDRIKPIVRIYKELGGTV